MADEVPAPLSGMARYEKGAILGEGTFGVVFQANDRLTEEVVAIKKIRLGKVKEVRGGPALARRLRSRQRPGFGVLFDLCRRHAGARCARERPRRRGDAHRRFCAPRVRLLRAP